MAMLFKFGILYDQFLLTGHYSKRRIQQHIKQIKQDRPEIRIGGSFLGNTQLQNMKEFAKKFFKRCVQPYFLEHVDIDLEMERHPNLGVHLHQFLKSLHKLNPNLTFSISCYQGERDLPILSLLKNDPMLNPILTLNTIGYFESFEAHKLVVQTYRTVFPAHDIYVGVSYRETDTATMRQLVQWAQSQEIKLGGVYFWNTSLDIPNDGKVSVFPYGEQVVEAMQKQTCPYWSYHYRRCSVHHPFCRSSLSFLP